MNLNKWQTLATALMALGVALGAFGAHGLKTIVSAEALVTWHTAVFYHIIHALSLLTICNAQNTLNMRPKGPVFLALFPLGILFFSGGLYLYVLTNIQFFALIVPIGGISFILGWVLLCKQFYQSR